MDELAIATCDAEPDLAGCLGEERIIAATPHIFTGMESGSALPHDNATCRDRLAAEELHAQHLGIGIAPVLGGA